MSTRGPAHCPERGCRCWGRAKLGKCEMHLKWWWNPWVDGQGWICDSVRFPSLGNTPSVKVGVSVGSNSWWQVRRFTDSADPPQLASCDRSLWQTSEAGSGFQSGVIFCPNQGKRSMRNMDIFYPSRLCPLPLCLASCTSGYPIVICKSSPPILA